jgi:hypothetical protein
MHFFPKLLVAVVAVLGGTCIGMYRLAVKDYKAYREKRHKHGF